VIASSVGFDSHEWGVTLFGSDPTDIKDIVYEMRFDPASSRYGEFGEFYIGRRFPPEDLGAYFAGETVPTPAGDGDTGDTEDGHGHAHGEGHDHAGSGGGSAHGDHPTARRRRAARATTRIRVRRADTAARMVTTLRRRYPRRARGSQHLRR